MLHARAIQMTPESERAAPNVARRPHQAASIGLRRTARSGPRPSQGGLLQRKCTCGGTPGPTGECEQCHARRLGLQRTATGAKGESTATSIVHQVLRSPGQSLDPTTRAFMEPRFGHDFSKVRVHADDQAVESANAVQALAYTVGNDVVFSGGFYSPSTPRGRALLAHELTHVVQQAHAGAPSTLTIDPADSPQESEADRAADAIMRGSGAVLTSSQQSAVLQRQQCAVNPDCPSAVEMLLPTHSFFGIGESCQGIPMTHCGARLCMVRTARIPGTYPRI